MSETKIRVLSVDDHRIVRDGIALILNREPDLEVVATAASGEEALTVFARHQPDVTLMDLQLPRMSGVDAIRAIRREHAAARIVVLTMYEGDHDIYEALEAGAAAYVLKDALSDDLIRVIREVHGGNQAIPPDVQARLGMRDPQKSLTPRELQVVELMGQAMRNKEIAASLGISDQTVHVHVKNVFLKLGVQDRLAAVMTARRRGMIHLR